MNEALVSRLNKQDTRPIYVVLLILTLILMLSSCRTGAEPVIRTITAETLTDKYSVSVDAARHEFDGNSLLVEGYVLNSVSMPKNDNEEGMVLIGAEKESSKGVQCWFTRYQSAEFVGLKPGNLITVNGIFSGEAGPTLKFCKLEKKSES